MSTDYRHENKYRIDSCQAAVLEARTRALLKPDANADDTGSYLIKNLYFDDYDDQDFFDIEDGYDDRVKYRIRYYGDDTSFIRLEKKIKLHGMTRKETCWITEDECREFIGGRIPPITDELSPKARELFLDMRLKNLIPKVIVIYEREPFVYEPGNVRVTFDKNLSSSNDLSSFLDKVAALRPVLRRGESLMEVKWDELLPRHIYDQLQLGNLQQTNFSKYYLCRKYNCMGGLRI